MRQYLHCILFLAREKYASGRFRGLFTLRGPRAVLNSKSVIESSLNSGASRSIAEPESVHG
jgi:hypothetical protein